MNIHKNSEIFVKATSDTTSKITLRDRDRSVILKEKKKNKNAKALKPHLVIYWF